MRVIDMKTWKTVKASPPGPGFFMRSRELALCLGRLVMSPSGQDTLTIIDKRTLEGGGAGEGAGAHAGAHRVHPRRPLRAPSVWEMDGAIVVYDAEGSGSGSR